MGMFDSFRVFKKNKIIEVQTKELECMMNCYNLGDTDSQFFNQPFIIEEENENLYYTFFFHQGEYFDYSVSPSEQIALLNAEQIIKNYSNPQFRIFNSKLIEKMNTNKYKKRDEIINELYGFFQSYKNKDIKSLFSFSRFDKEELTVENLEIRLKQSMNDYFDEKDLISNLVAEVHFEKDFIHPLFKNVDCSIDQSVAMALNQALQNFDISAFYWIQEKRKDWVDLMYQNQEFIEKLRTTILSFAGCFFYLNLYKITNKKDFCFYYGNRPSDFQTPLQKHIEEIMGFDTSKILNQTKRMHL